MAVDPSLIASREYSTWNKRPSGEKVLIPAFSTTHVSKGEAVVILNSTIWTHGKLKKLLRGGEGLPYSDRAKNIFAGRRSAKSVLMPNLDLLSAFSLPSCNV